MSSGTPPPGLKHTQSITVTPELTVPSVSPHFAGFQDMPPVFATAFMVGLVVDTCVAALGAGFHERCIIDLDRFLARLGGRKKSLFRGCPAPAQPG